MEEAPTAQPPQEDDEVDEADEAGIDDDEPTIDEQHSSHIKSYAKSKPYVTENEVECAGFFDDYLYRQTVWSGMILLFSLLGIGRMFAGSSAPDCGYPEGHDDYRTILIGFTLCGVALIVILICSLIALILSVLKRRIFGFVLFILLLLGSLIYMFGSWIIVSEIPYIYCIVGASGSLFGGYGATFFGEFFFFASFTILLGLDLWRDKYLNEFKLRMLLFCSITAFSALVTFFGYAILANYLYKENLSQYAYTAQDYAFTAAGWFFIFAAMLFYLIVLLSIKKSIIYLICSVVLIVATLICAIGYWALNQRGKDADNAYYIGMSFFLLGVGICLAIDMSLGKYIKKMLKR